MKKLITAAVASAIAIVGMASVSTTAEAREGCGRGGHRGPMGHCRPNMGPRGDAWVVGRHYPGRGYWDGRGWYKHRVRHAHGWRYW